MIQEKILAAALTLFAERGFSRTTSSALARQAGIAEGTMFRHFSSKDDILLSLLVQLKTQLIQAVEDKLEPYAGSSGLQQLLAAVHYYHTIASSGIPEFTVIFRDAFGSITHEHTEAHQEIKSAYRFLINHLQNCIEQGMRDGSIRQGVNSSDTASIVMGTVVGMARGLHFSFIEPSDTLQQTVNSTFERILAAPGGATAIS